MQRIRFFRVLLPTALILFLALLIVSLRDRPPVHGTPMSNNGVQSERGATGVTLIEIDGERKALDFVADVVEPQPDGGYHLEMIERLTISRENGAPLIIRARGADIEGPAGARKIVARDEVIITDPEAGLVLTLPQLEVYEADGEARSIGEIVLEGAGSSGRASRLVYGLAGQPSQLYDPLIERADGTTTRADQAILFDGLDDVEFQGAVEASRGEERFTADRLRLRRDAEERLRDAEASGQVAGRFLTASGALADLRSERLEAHWDTEGELERMLLGGNASVGRATDSISASSIEAVRDAAATDPWSVSAEGTVYAQGRFGGGPAWIRSETLRASLNDSLEFRSATAEGHVRVEAPSTRAEADRAEFDATIGLGEIRLLAVGNRKARMARERTRVAAESIVTDPRGIGLRADGRVEATLMPGEDGLGTAGADGLFLGEQAIHFVAVSLEGHDSANRLVFRGGVRGWQGERNLSADEIELRRLDNSLGARGNVTTRVPREADGAILAETDFLQIAADDLDYDGGTRRAVYRGHVRVTLLEGWLEADRIEVQLSEDEGGIHEIWAYDNVRIEFRDLEERDAPRLVSGTADRVSYVPGEQTVRLFGDEKPASVRRLGTQGATTTGRVLRYQLDVGTLEVESGEQAPASIRGS